MKQLLLFIAVCALAELSGGCSLIVGNKLDDYEFADGGVRDGSADADEDSGPSDAGGDGAMWDGGVYDAAQDAARDSGNECSPLQLRLPERYAGGEVIPLSVPWDAMPGEPGDTITVCMSMALADPPSARCLDTDNRLTCIGPCGAIAEPGPFEDCREYERPADGTPLTLRNSPREGSRCDEGWVEDLAITFRCAQ